MRFETGARSNQWPAGMRAAASRAKRGALVSVVLAAGLAVLRDIITKDIGQNVRRVEGLKYEKDGETFPQDACHCALDVLCRTQHN